MGFGSFNTPPEGREGSEYQEQDDPKRESPLSDEILLMADADREMRNRVMENVENYEAELDKQNTERLKQIVSEVGWPTISKVGKEAAQGAWLIVQHADHDPAFQEECLRLMREGGEDVNPPDVAYLEDRVRVNTGRKQLYGTQWYVNDAGESVPRPIEDPENLEQRRAEAGLEPFADYEKHMKGLDKEE